ncbi:MAG: glycosyltransferase [Bacteroidetes bacterium]|nr:glycosyltransferase [Bacteroidota bacterium]
MKNILILTYWSYHDALIQTYTLPYVKIILKNLPKGSKIYLLTLEKDGQALKSPKRSEIETAFKSDEIEWLPIQYQPFGFFAFFMWTSASLKLSLLILQKKISVIHCWCTPAGAIGYLLATLLNRKLVIDSYEPHAEAMVENGTWTRKSLAFRLLFWLEKKQTQKAEFIIAATKGMREYAQEKYEVSIHQYFVKPACVDLNLFSIKDIKNEKLLEELNLSGKIVCVYAGKFGGIYLDKEVFDFLKVASEYWGESFRVLILTSHKRNEIVSFCNSVGLSPEIVISLFVDHKQVPTYLGLGDFAMTPVKPVNTKRFCTPIKDGEYWALGLPVVIPANISDDSAIIEKTKIGVVLTRLEYSAYREAIEKMDKLLHQESDNLYSKIRSVAEQYRSFDIAEKVYASVYA